MRFDPRTLKFEFGVAAFLMATLIAYGSSANAQTQGLTQRTQDNLHPIIKGAPKTVLNWSDMRKARKMNFSQLRSKLKPADEFAALYALQIALSRVGDGQTYVWGRPKRKLRALITPVSSYREKNGRICRKITVSLALGSYMKRIQTAACRAEDRSWKIQS